MASVCGGCLALMDAGVPMKAHVAGIAMGLIKDGNRFAVLTDILGDEDHLGDMDFKVAGTTGGITALQMDIKIQGITKEIMQVALAQAKEARLHILGKMQEAMGEAKAEVSQFAPRLYTMKINPEKIRDVIGKGGAVDPRADRGNRLRHRHRRGRHHHHRLDRRRQGGVRQEAHRPRSPPRSRSARSTKARSPRSWTSARWSTSCPARTACCTSARSRTSASRRSPTSSKEGQIVKVKVLETDEKGRVKLSMKALLERPEGMEEERERPPRREYGDRAAPRPRRPWTAPRA